MCEMGGYVIRNGIESRGEKTDHEQKLVVRRKETTSLAQLIIGTVLVFQTT